MTYKGKHFSITLDSELYEKIKTLAKKEKRSMSQMIAYLCEIALNKEDENTESKNHNT
ncbi:ribbon-helix-helix domain-containing protein [Scytonema hofmannii]|uniref:ribbon-helix-helix domain-containing protein n=1 Tax=Scytonema hofmannii TaxID=34078 RepID=UPI00034D70CC|nr:ribbon-helix-helix protein, CopG family [Scytonema hofmannii]